MRYISRVVSTVKKSCDVTLGPKTLIVGPNGSGKTTIIQSLELATCGYATDLEGRDLVQQQAALSRLFPPDVIPSAECWLDDGTQFHWSMKPKAGVGAEGFHEPVHHAPVNVNWPWRDVQSILLGDTSRLARWLEEQVIGPSPIEQVLAQLPPEVRDEVALLSKKSKTTDLMELANQAKSEARALRLNATKVEKTVDQMVQGVPAPLTEQEMAVLKDRLATAPSHVGMITQQQYDALLAEKTRIIEQSWHLEQEKNQIPQVSAKGFEALERIKKAKAISHQHQSHFPDAPNCFVCGKGTGSDVVHFSRELDTIESTLAINPADLNRRRAIETQQTTLLEKLASVEHQLSTSRVTAGTPSDLEEIKARIITNEMAIRVWANHSAKQKSITRDRVLADHYTTASKVLSSLGKDLIQQKKAAFEAKVATFLPKHDQFAIDLHAARVGLVRNGNHHTALSGAEHSRVLLALASASMKHDALNILSSPDRAWDPNTLASVMVSLLETPAQVVLMSTVEPAFVPAYWTVVKLWT